MYVCMCEVGSMILPCVYLVALTREIVWYWMVRERSDRLSCVVIMAFSRIHVGRKKGLFVC